MDLNKRIIAEDAEVGCIPPQRALERSGIELMRDMLAGKIPPPPISRLMNFVLTDAAEGMAEFRGIPLRDHYNPFSTVHGGWAGTIMDSALGCAVSTMMKAGMGSTTIEFKINLVRPISADTGEVVCVGKVTHFGRTTAVSEASLKTVDGKLLALGTETCAIFPLEKPGR